MAGGSEKAFFTNIDKGSEVFHVQFNPKELKLDEKAIWKPSGEQQTQKPLLTYEKGQPGSMSMDLIFDSTDDGSNCYDSHVKKLRAFLCTTVTKEDKDGNEIKRPPYLRFTWGGFNFECVLESLTTQFMMFKPDGTPLRAKVTVGLKERRRGNMGGSGNSGVTLSAMGSMFSEADNVKTTQVQEGDTMSSVSQRSGGDMRDMSNANGVDDPMNPPVGDTMVVPADSQQADVLAAQNQSQPPQNW